MPPAERRHKRVYFVRSGEQERRSEIFAKLRPLFGCQDVRVDGGGNIFYHTWRGLDKLDEGLLSPNFIRISRVHPQADIYARHSRYESFSTLEVHQVTKDRGSVEAAIRSVEYILEGERGREVAHAGVVRARAQQVFDLFNTSFRTLTREELGQAERETLQLMIRVGLNPATVEDELKRQMTASLLKGSLGQDSLQRRNYMIAAMRLSRAYRKASERERGVGAIASKFAGVREALIFAREMSREIFGETSDRLRPEALPAHMLFKYPEGRESQKGTLLGLLGTMRYGLTQVQVKTYRTAAIQVIPELDQVIALLKSGKRAEIASGGYFPRIHALLVAEYDKFRDIYPVAEPPDAT